MIDMKKMICIILAFLYLLVLCGCNGTVESASSERDSQVANDALDTTEASETESNGLAYDFAVSMTIPAAITVYLDNEMQMVSVESSAPEAEALLAGLNITAIPYEEAMMLVLQAAYDQGILKSGDFIGMDIDPIEMAPSTVAQLHSPFLQYELINELELSVAPNFVIEEPEEGASQIEFGGQKLYVHRASVMSGQGDNFEEAGVITTYTNKNVFLEDPTKYAAFQFGKYHNGEFYCNCYGEGVRTRSYVLNADGTFVCWEYENEQCIYEFSQSADGMTLILAYYANGETKEYEHYWNGEYYKSTYLEGNIRIFDYIRYADGSSYEANYDEQGNLTGNASYDANGNYTIYEFYPNGITKSEEIMVDGICSKTVYNEDGTILSSETN